MSENLIDRVKRLVSGSLNSMVDAVENASPELVMKEAIREVDNVIVQLRDELGKLVADKHLATKRLMDANQKHEELSSNIQLAVREGRDELAQAAIERQMDLEAQMPVLEAAIQDASARENELDSYINALKARKREMEAELDSFVASQEAAAAPGSDQARASRASDTESRLDKADEAFNRAMKAGSSLPGLERGERKDAARLAELEELARANRVAERLASVKQAMKD